MTPQAGNLIQRFELGLGGNPLCRAMVKSILKTILLVDDAQDTRITTKWFLSTFGFAVVSATSGEEALAIFDPEVHDLVLTDNSMPGLTGTELAHIIKLRSPSTPVVMFTGQLPKDTSCVDLVIERPAHLIQVKESIEKVLAKKFEN